MDKRWMPITGGILAIILGILALFSSFVIIIYFLLALFGMWVYSGFNFINYISDGGLNILLSIYITFIILLIFSGILGTIGGFFAIKRDKWKLVLSGSLVVGIMAILCGIFLVDQLHMSPGYMSFICMLGVASPILVIISKKQFKLSPR